jgi:hypothetical protein
LLAADLDLVEHTAHDLDRFTGPHWHRSYPRHLNSARTYGDEK